jgi:hypothetical protein
MKKELTEHSKELRIKTSKEWQKNKILNGGYRLTVLLSDKEVADFARNQIPNKAEFIVKAIKKYMLEVKKAG